MRNDFDKEKFSYILQNIQALYDNQEIFSKYSGVGRTYISQYINMKLNTPPKPQLLKKIAEASKGITTFKELMYICGYLSIEESLFYSYLLKIFEYYNDDFKEIGLNDIQIHSVLCYFFDEQEKKYIENIITNLKNEKIDTFKNIINNINKSMENQKKVISNIIDEKFDTYYNEIDLIPIYTNENGSLTNINKTLNMSLNLNSNKNIFAYQIDDDDMLPLLGTGDIAIVEKMNTFESGYTCLFSIDNKDIMIRKIIDFQNYIELHTAFPYSQPIRLTKEEMISRNFTILGRIIKVENQSAFK